MVELSSGDYERIEEVKSWLKQGMTIESAREKLNELGYSEYHIDFLLEESTGQRFLPKKPEILIDTTKIRIAMMLIALGLLVGAIIFFAPELILW